MIGNIDRRTVLGLSAGTLLASFTGGAAKAGDAPARTTVLAQGLRFPEGPVAMADGSVIVTEIADGRLTRVHPDGTTDLVADTGGGPNGAALGPDGALYVCNNGGFEWSEVDGLLVPGHQAHDYSGGSIQRVDLATGDVAVLYEAVDGMPLKGPNDLVFDTQGGFWFTDHGKSRPRDRDHGGLYYARADGSMIIEALHGLYAPNGIGLSPDGKTLYVALTFERQVLAFDIIGVGRLDPGSGLLPGRPVASLPANRLLDSMAVGADGTVHVATLLDAGITSIAPDGTTAFTALADPLTTNICFGGPAMRTAYITLSGTGALVAMDWPAEGLRLNFTG